MQLYFGSKVNIIVSCGKMLTIKFPKLNNYINNTFFPCIIPYYKIYILLHAFLFHTIFCFLLSLRISKW